jgi:hypothetical protein
MKILKGEVKPYVQDLDTGALIRTGNDTTSFITPLDFTLICVKGNPELSGSLCVWRAYGVPKNHFLYKQLFTIKEIR